MFNYTTQLCTTLYSLKGRQRDDADGPVCHLALVRVILESYLITIYIYIYIFKYTYVYVHMRVSISLSFSLSIYIYIYTCTQTIPYYNKL